MEAVTVSTFNQRFKAKIRFVDVVFAAFGIRDILIKKKVPTFLSSN